MDTAQYRYQALIEVGYADSEIPPVLDTALFRRMLLEKLTGGGSGFSGNYNDLTNKPTLGDAAAKDTGTTAGTVAAGDDSRVVAGGTALQVVRQTFSNSNVTVNAATTILAQTGTMSILRGVTLPLAASVRAGWPLVIADESGTVTTGIYLSLQRAGSDTINGATVENITTAYGQRRLISDGVSKWSIDAGLARVGVANTFTANQTLNGTANTAPNQTAASGSSVMTRDLSDARYKLFYYLPTNSVICINTTTLANSTVQLTLGVGIWLIDSQIGYANANNTQGAKVGMTFSGTAANYGLSSSRYTDNLGSLIAIAPAGIMATHTYSSSQSANAMWTIRGVLNVTAAGILTIQGAQQTAEASNHIFRQGSWVRATQLN